MSDADVVSLDLSFVSDISITDLINTTSDSLRKLNVETDALLENLRNATNEFIDRIIIFYLRHNLTLDCLEDLMQLLNLQRELCDQLPTHKKQILKLFRENKDMIEVIYFIRCGKCSKIIEKKSESVEKVMCCDTVLKKTETNFYVHMPLEKQIIQSINHNWDDIKSFDTTANIQFNSIHTELLPPKIRFLPDNVLVSGLLYTEDVFDFREYFLPIVRELQHLKQHKIVMEIDNETYTFQPIVTHCSVDLPAKGKFQETKQFGGYDACSYCEIPGVKVLVNCKRKIKTKQINTSPEGELKQVEQVRYPEPEGNPYPLRDEKETLEKMLAASSCRNKDIDGIKDVSCLVALQHFKIIRSMGIDYLHCVLLGIEKRLINFFCEPMYSKSKYYITEKRRQLLNKRILAIKPNREVNRKPRSLEQRSKFKGSEFRSMLLFYLPVCLPGCVSDVYVKHFRILSAAIYILLKSTITREEQDEAEKMLHKFVKQHQELFGVDNMVMNVHLLKHLVEDVRSLGPLWTHTTFPFERNNGVLLKKANGTTDVLQQISSKYCLSKTMIHRQNKLKLNEKILLGRSVKIVENCLRVFNVETMKEIDFSNKELYVHKRINLKNIIYTSTSYTLPKMSVDFFVELNSDFIGTVKYYFESNSKAYAIIDEFEVIANIHHILEVQPTNRSILAPVEDIRQKYIYMKVGLHRYIASPPNPYEKE